MGYSERNSWAGLVMGLASIVTYLLLVVPQLFDRPVSDVFWALPMLATILGGIVATVVVSAIWGSIERSRHPDDRSREDVRDKAIAKLGGGATQGFLALGIVAGIVGCAYTIEPFWIAQILYAGAALAAIADGITRVTAYRRGF